MQASKKEQGEGFFVIKRYASRWDLKFEALNLPPVLKGQNLVREGMGRGCYV